jgi:hypothetical protein
VNPAWRTTPSVIPMTAGPIAAPAIALAACAEAILVDLTALVVAQRRPGTPEPVAGTDRR